MSLSIRWASPTDQAWVDAQYQSIDFLPSDLSRDRVAIAYWEKQRAGLGRLVPIADQQWELGGMYVLPHFRQKGIARPMVQHLLAASPVGSTLYCVPFLHLSSFYESCGFRPVLESERDAVPQSILDKCNWCNTHYENQAGLLVMYIE